MEGSIKTKINKLERRLKVPFEIKNWTTLVQMGCHQIRQNTGCELSSPVQQVSPLEDCLLKADDWHMDLIPGQEKRSYYIMKQIKMLIRIVMTKCRGVVGHLSPLGPNADLLPQSHCCEPLSLLWQHTIGHQLKSQVYLKGPLHSSMYLLLTKRGVFYLLEVDVRSFLLFSRAQECFSSHTWQAPPVQEVNLLLILYLG